MKKQGENHHWNAEKIAAAIRQFIQENNRLPVAREMNPQNGLPTRKTFEKIIGMTWGQYAKFHYPELVELGEIRHQQRVLDIRREQSEWTKEKLILAVKRFAEQNGRLPLIQEYTTENALPSYTTFCKISERAMVEYLKKQFNDFIDQNHILEEDEDDSSFKMHLKL